MNKVSTETFNLTFRAHADGSVNYVIVRPDTCYTSSKAQSLDEMFDRVKKEFTEFSRMYGVEVER